LVAAPALALLVGCGGAGVSPMGNDGSSPSDTVVVEPPLPTLATADVVARRLAAMIWDGEPDGALVSELKAAPISREAVGGIADRMLGDPRARRGMTAFFGHWLLLLPEANPEPGSLLASMQQEAPALGMYLTVDSAGTLADLLQAPYTFVDETLARHYGLTDVSGPAFRKVPYPAGQPRVGVLSGAGMLSHYSSLLPSGPSWPAKRSWMVTDPLLCTPIIRSFLPSIVPDVSRSIRQQMIDATANGTCMACHAYLNSPGFAFIGFDVKGIWHPEPGAAANETQGWIPDKIMPDAPTFEGPASLAQLLANRDETRRCYVRQWMQYAIDRKDITIDIPEDQRASIEVALRAFAASGYRLRAAIVAVAQSNPVLRP
jgi:hypothetical protein